MDRSLACEDCTPIDTLTALERINRAIVSDGETITMLNRVLDEMLDIFDCERAWVVYPCVLEPRDTRLLAERTRPGFEGLLDAGGQIPEEALEADLLRFCLDAPGPVRFDPESFPLGYVSARALEDFGVKSMLVMAMSPDHQAPWMLGIHHCDNCCIYKAAVDLFHVIAQRIRDALTTHLTLQRLRESEARHRTLFYHATEAIVIFDVDSGVFVDANPAAGRLYGMRADDLIGKLGPQQLSPRHQPDGRESADLTVDYIRRALEGEQPSFEWVHVNSQGEEVPCAVSLTRFPDPTRKLVRGALTDISTRKAEERARIDLQAQLAQAQRLEAVGQMTGGVAHDFNNLLSVILGNLELLRDDVHLPDLREMIDAAIRATLRGADLTRKMLSFARRAHLEPRVLDLNALVREMDNWMRRTLPANIVVRLSLAEGLWPVEADQASTESALLNLIINARDAMPDGGTLTVETANSPDIASSDTAGASKGEEGLPPGNHVTLAVHDDGVGIGKLELARVFEPFYTTKSPGEGSGLGLSMVHGFMSQSGGAVRIQSDKGQGTSVRLLFRRQNDTVTGPGATTAELPQSGSTSARILLAEDEAEVMRVLARTLRARGYDVVTAESGDKAEELYSQEGPFDLLVTDIVMPGRLQGPDLARALRQVKPDLPVVFLSGYAREAELQSDGKGQRDIRLMKPVSRGRLLQAVQEVLGESAS